MKTIALCMALLAVLATGIAAQDTPAFDGKTAAQWSAAIQQAPDDPARATLIEKLGRPGEKAQPVLLALLDDPKLGVKQFAADALVVSGWTAIPALEARGRKQLVERILRHPFVRYPAHFPKDRTYKCGPEPRFDPVHTVVTCEFAHRVGFATYRFKWVDGVLRVDCISHQPSFRRDPLATPVEFKFAKIDTARGRAMIRALLTATRVAIATEPAPDEPRVMGTTLHFHGNLFIEENGKGIYGSDYSHRVGKRFSDSFLQMLLYDGIVREATEGLAWTERKVDEEDRSWLARRTRALSKEDWEIADNFSLLVRAFGDQRFRPWLEQVITETDKGMQRHLRYAIDAYARLTGVDYRPQEFTWKQAHEVRLKYLEHFKQADGDD